MSCSWQTTSCRSDSTSGRAIDAGTGKTIMALAAGREVLLWRRITFRVALTFTAQVCDSVEYDGGD